MAGDLVEYLKLVAYEDDGAWINIHHLKGGIMPGNAHQTIRAAVQDVMYWSRKGYDVYMAQGVYVNAMPANPKFPYRGAIRQETNLSMCRCLYMDMDVKKDAYASQEELLEALDAFTERKLLPKPTVMVSSGTGGVHIYWVMIDLFEPKEFRRRAAQLINAARDSGIIFDAQCTIDPVRLLRPPETWNFKRAVEDGSDALPVRLIHKGERVENTFMWSALDQFSDVHITPGSKRSAAHVHPENAKLMGGFDKPTYAPADIDEAAKECPFIRDTLANGGAALQGEPQWHAVINLASFCKDPEATAHRLCCGSEHYDPDGTDEKLEKEEQQKANRPDIGPYKCEGIARLGMPQCVACPHRNLGTTPLLVQGKRTNGHPYLAPVTPGRDLPPGYYRGRQDWIYVVEPDDGGDSAHGDTCVFPYPIVPQSGFMERGMPSRFTFESKLGSGAVDVSVTLPASCVTDKVTFHRALLDQAMPLPTNVDKARLFMTSYLQQLQASPHTLITRPAFGWDKDNDGATGFSFGGRFVSPNGVDKCAAVPEGLSGYKVGGDTAAWRELAKIIVTPDRPDLCVMVAAAFGAPLLKPLGCEGVIIGLWSSQSGIGKTTSMKLGQAVWGQPVLGGMDDTVNYTFAKCGRLRHLPMYYDEVKGETQILSMCKIAFSLTRGKEKGRLKRSSEMMEPLEFETSFIYATNASVVEEVRDHHKGTDADMLRMFECRALEDAHLDQYYVSEVASLVALLKDNYGGIGQEYAEFLGKNYDNLVKTLQGVQNQLQQQWLIPKEYRFWMAAITTTFVGAKLANMLGFCEFPLNEMMDYMRKEYSFLRHELISNPNDYSKITAVTNTLMVYINEKFARNTIMLDKTWSKSGRPPKDYATILNAANMNQWQRLEIQISGDPLTLRVSDAALGEWCKKAERPKSGLIGGMKKFLNARLAFGVIGSGSHKGAGGENIWIIPVKGTPLEDMLEFAIHHKFLPP